MIYLKDTKNDWYYELDALQKSVRDRKSRYKHKKIPENILYICNYAKRRDIYIDYIELKKYYDFVTCPTCKRRSCTIDTRTHLDVCHDCYMTCSICKNKVDPDPLMQFMIIKMVKEKLGKYYYDPVDTTEELPIDEDVGPGLKKIKDAQDIDLDKFEEEAEEGIS